AFEEVVALREAGVAAHYGYVGGYRLQKKIGDLPFAHAVIEKAQNPRTFFGSASAIRDLIQRIGFDIVHAHLTYDHWLARLATRNSPTRLARTFHSRRTLRADPFTHSLVAHTDHLFVINETFAGARVFGRRPAAFTPPPVDHQQFSTTGPNVRPRYAMQEQPVIAAIGKLAPGRGFELVLRSFALVRSSVPGTKLMIIGHGEHRSALDALAEELGIGKDVIWAGYHEEDLAEHYRAADLLLFTAPGSDEGHRAILEAMACGVPAVSAPLPGATALLGDLSDRLIASDGTPDALASIASRELKTRDAALREAVVRRSMHFDHPRAAARLLAVYR
ncbi:MAG TPA: glycosyltransferase family 4 protein, partial [Thermoanaerobaculia bacterium]|nr:glycosyltransferase family 4 protein [Thermoanaerobaculia bacterium]